MKEIVKKEEKLPFKLRTILQGGSKGPYFSGGFYTMSIGAAVPF